MASDDEEEEEKSRNLLEQSELGEVVIVPSKHAKDSLNQEESPRQSSKVVQFLETIPLSGQILTFLCSIIFTTVASIIKVLDEVRKRQN